MKLNFYLTILFLVPTCLFSQNSNDKTVYLDSLWKETTKENHKYYRIIKDHNIEKDSYKVYEYYKSGKLEMEGTSSTKENLTREGEFIFYYENGNKESVENYVKSKLNGKLYKWYENGNKRLEGEYIQDDKTISGKLKFLQCWNENGKQTVVDGNGYYESNDKYYLNKGEIKDGFKNGVWTGVSYQNKYTYSEKYKNGLMISGLSIDDDGTRHEYFVMDLQPQPKKGIQDFYNYIGKKFKYTKESIKNDIKGKIIVQFVIDRDGKIVEPKILKSLGYGLDEEAIRVITKYKDWIPGEQRGRKVRVLYSIPIVLAGIK